VIDLTEKYATQMKVMQAFPSGSYMRRNYEMNRLIMLRGTVPDFCWPDKKKVVYLDGVQVHTKTKVELRDEEIDTMLKTLGWQVLRVPYTPPLLLSEVDEIVQKIQEFLK